MSRTATGSLHPIVVKLGHLGRPYGCLVGDTARVKNRIKSLYRSRGVSCGAGREVYGKRGREAWVERLPEAVRPRAELLYEDDLLMALRREAQKSLLAEARRHREWYLR